MSTFGVIVSTRSFFPGKFAKIGRKEIIAKLKKMGHEVIVLSEKDTKYGAIESYEDSKKCAKLFSENRDKIQGIIVILPNFGDEVSVVTAIDLAKLNVPVLVHASDDNLDKEGKLSLDNRRDAFCGKFSVCNNLRQYNIKFTNTTYQTCAINSDVFTKDIKYFEKVCRVVNGIRKAGLGAIGARPAVFQTLRFSEKLLQASGITTRVVDMSEIIASAQGMPNSKEVRDRIAELKAYGNIPSYIKEDKIVKQAKLGLVIEKWMKDNRCDASAVACWSSIEDNYGCAPCASMSLMGEKGMPSACEMDLMGALSMYALYLASGKPAGYLDWNNNYMDERNKCINTHCSSFPKSFFGRDFEISNLDVLGKTLGPDKCFGACKGNVAAGPMTFAKIDTDDVKGKIRAYIGEGEFTDDIAILDGGVAVCYISKMQKLFKYICKEGFEHHVAMSRSLSADVLEEALGNYLGWDIYRHGKE